MSRYIEKLVHKLQNRQADNSLRILSTVRQPVDFFSNDYLGLSQSKSLQKQVAEAYQSISCCYTGATGSRLLSGNLPLFEEVEEYLCQVLKSESALLFNSGYVANTGLFQSVPQRQDVILYDELIHASIKEGMRLSFADKFSFHHNSVENLEKRLTKFKGKHIYVVVESVYSMDGDMAPLLKILQLCEKYDAALIVDEAHSTGIFGTNGAGICEELGIEDRIFARVSTFGKAIGGHGAIVLGARELKDYLINFSLSFIYTTALPIHSLVSIRESFKFIAKNPTLIESLHKKINLFNSEVHTLNGYINSKSPIQAIKIGGVEKTRQFSSMLKNQGFDIRPILSPTVKKGEERLRICLHEYNSSSEIRELTKLLHKELNSSLSI